MAQGERISINFLLLGLDQKTGYLLYGMKNPTQYGDYFISRYFVRIPVNQPVFR